jgi:hypothetical protein
LTQPCKRFLRQNADSSDRCLVAASNVTAGRRNVLDFIGALLGRRLSPRLEARPIAASTHQNGMPSAAANKVRAQISSRE